MNQLSILTLLYIRHQLHRWTVRTDHLCCRSNLDRGITFLRRLQNTVTAFRTRYRRLLREEEQEPQKGKLTRSIVCPNTNLCTIWLRGRLNDFEPLGIPFQLSLMRSGDVNGLVIAGLGLGGVTSPMYDAIQEARAKGVPVVISTRVPTGRIFPLSAMKGSSLTLRQIGCVLADNLSPQKARVLLMLALTKTRDPGALQKYFDN